MTSHDVGLNGGEFSNKRLCLKLQFEGEGFMRFPVGERS